VPAAVRSLTRAPALAGGEDHCNGRAVGGMSLAKIDDLEPLARIEECSDLCQHALALAHGDARECVRDIGKNGVVGGRRKQC